MISTATPERANAVPGPQGRELGAPERCAVDLVIAGAIGLLAIVCVWPFFDFVQFSFVDEGIVLQGAVRILHGEVPYRDFFSFYTPASYYLYASLFHWFGISLRVARAVLIFYAALLAWMTYMLARRACPRTGSFIAGVFLALVGVSPSFVAGHNWDSTAAAMVALYFAVWLLQTGAARWALLCGFMTGVTLMIDQSRGGGLVLGLAIAAGALHWLQTRRWNVRHLVSFVSGAALPVAVVVVYFAAHNAWKAMIAAWVWPFQHYAGVNKVALGYAVWGSDLRQAFELAPPAQRAVMLVIFSGLIAIVAIPLLSITVTAVAAARIRLASNLPARNTSQPQIETPELTAFAVLGGSVLLGVMASTVASGRADWHHIAILAPFSFYLMPLILDVRLLPVAQLARLKPLLAGYLLVAFVLVNMLLGLGARTATHKTWTRRGVIRTASPDEVLPYLQAHTTPGQKVLIYPYLPLYSFLSATVSPTKFEYLQPGLHAPEQFEQARQELEADKTPVVLFQLRFRDEITRTWPSTPATVIAADPMGDYIFRHYKPCRTLPGAHEPFVYMVRMELECP